LKDIKLLIEGVLSRWKVIVVCVLLLSIACILIYSSLQEPLTIDALSQLVKYHAIRTGLAISSIIVVAYLFFYEWALINWKKRMKTLRETIHFLGKKDKERLLAVSRRGREQSMIEMGSLFIPTAFLLLGAAATSSTFIYQSARIGLALSAPILYVLWLFLVQLSTRLMDDVDSNVRLYANDGAGRVLHLFYEDRHGWGLVMWLRRNHWLAYLPLLVVGATLIISSITSSK